MSVTTGCRKARHWVELQLVEFIGPDGTWDYDNVQDPAEFFALPGFSAWRRVPAEDTWSPKNGAVEVYQWAVAA